LLVVAPDLIVCLEVAILIFRQRLWKAQAFILSENVTVV
jgi:hypothetical protein